MDPLTQRAQRLIDEFEEGENVRHGIANVLNHLAYAFDKVCDGEGESMVGVPVSTLDELAVELTVPNLKESALEHLNSLIALIPTEGAIAMAEPIRAALETLPNV